MHSNPSSTHGSKPKSKVSLERESIVPSRPHPPHLAPEPIDHRRVFPVFALLNLFFPSRSTDPPRFSLAEERLDCESRRMSQFTGRGGRAGGSASTSVTVSVKRDALGG